MDTGDIISGYRRNKEKGKYKEMMSLSCARQHSFSYSNLHIQLLEWVRIPKLKHSCMTICVRMNFSGVQQLQPPSLYNNYSHLFLLITLVKTN